VKITTNSLLIEDLIRDIQKKEPAVCGAPVKGSPYARIFAEPVEKSTYDADDD